MPKHRRHVLFRSFIESHINPEKHDEIKRAKTVIEGNVRKILQALGDNNNDGKEQVVNLVEDFHKHYQSLYERYDHLTEELRKKADGKHGNDSWLSRSDSSDSAWEYQTALGETQEAQNTIRELNSEAENWNDEKHRLQIENARVFLELVLAKSEIARLSTMQKVGEEERSKLTSRISQLDVIEHKCPVTQSVKLSENNDEIVQKEATDKRPELCYSNRAETSRKELDKRTVEHQEVPEGTLWDKENEVEEDKQKYEVQLGTIGNNEKLQEVESSKKQKELLQSEKSQLETQVERSKQESEDLKREISALSDNLRHAKFVQHATSQKLQVAVELLIHKQEEQKVLEDALKGRSSSASAEVDA